MDLSNTTVRWINLDSSPAKSSESVSVKSTGKNPNLAFSASLNAIHQGQGHAHSGKSLPHEEQSTDSIEVRVLTTDSNRAASVSSNGLAAQTASRASNPPDAESRTNQTDLINEISAFNKESQTGNTSLAESGDPLTTPVKYFNAHQGPAESSTQTDRPAIADTVSLSATPKGTPVELTDAQQVNIAEPHEADAPTFELTPAQTNSSTPQTLQPAGSDLASSVKLESTQQTVNTNTIAANLASNTEPTNIVRARNPLNAEIQLVATQPLGKQASVSDKPNKAAIALGSGQEFKLPDASRKQAPVKLVMIEASATLQQWQKLKQLDGDKADSSLEPLSTLQPSEARSLRASPELQTARLIKTEQDAQALSQKFAEQLGQRLIQNVQKGHWRAELELHPRSLGRIDVQLDFVNGQLEGHFQTHNPHTRELLQEGLPRLREWLQQTGTQVANLEVNNGNSGQGGEKPTPQMLAGRQNDSVTDEPVAELLNQDAKSQTLKEGFDLLV